MVARAETPPPVEADEDEGRLPHLGEAFSAFLDLSRSQVDLRFIYRSRKEQIVRPILLWFGSTQHFHEPQWHMTALDLEDNCIFGKQKDFTLAEMSAVLAVMGR